MVMKKLIDDFGELHLGQLKLAYDGRNIFYTAGQLPFTSKDFELTVIERRRYVCKVILIKDFKHY